MPVRPGRRRLSRLESGAGELAAVISLVDKARADSGDASLRQGPRSGPLWPADPRQGPG